MDKSGKNQIVQKWRQNFASAKSLVMTSFQGLNAAEIADLRRRCKEGGLDYIVLKNTLARLALKETQFEVAGENLRGPVGWAVSYGDEISGAKLISKYAKENDKFKVVGGALKNKVLTAAEVDLLATMPGLNEVRAQFLGLLTSVPTKFVATLNELPVSLVRVVDARRAALEKPE